MVSLFSTEAHIPVYCIYKWEPKPKAKQTFSHFPHHHFQGSDNLQNVIDSEGYIFSKTCHSETLVLQPHHSITQNHIFASNMKGLTGRETSAIFFFFLQNVGLQEKQI